MSRSAKILLSILVFLGALWALSYRAEPERIEYGVTFSPMYAEELGLEWREVYRAMLEELGVKRLRLAAYWEYSEPERDVYDWRDLDFQIREAKKHNAEIILSIGRRLPRWPECHVPYWVGYMPWEEQKMEIRQYLTAVVERYRDEEAIVMWQVENEPFLRVFATEHCGELDVEFFDEELALVRSLDNRPILITDGGNTGLWAGAYKRADVFGTSMYLYFWNETAGAFRTALPSSYYRVKTNLMRILFGEREVILSELSLEPWFGAAVETVPIPEQINRMSLEKIEEILAYAKSSRLGTQYLWGVEWWYYMREKGHPEFWERMKRVYAE